MSKKKAYLIERPLAPHELTGCLELLKLGEASVYVRYAYPVLEEAGAIVYTGLSNEKKTTVNQELLDNLNKLGHRQAGKDSVAGHLLFRGFPTWYYHKFRINIMLQQRLQLLEQLRYLKDRHSRLVVYTVEIPSSYILKELPHVLFIPAANASQAPQAKRNNFKQQFSQMWKRYKAGGSQQTEIPKPYPRHLFVLNYAHIQAVLDPAHLPKLAQDNVFVSYFLRTWSDQFLLIDKLILDKTARGSQHTNEGPYFDRPFLYNERVEWPALLNPGVWWQLWQYHKHLKKAYKKIRRYLKDSVSQQVFQEVEKLHNSSLFFFLIYLSYRKFFSKHRFKTVTVLDEYSPNFRAIMDAARKEGVRTHAIQHGSLAAINPGYGYVAEDERFNPWPDRTLVWGDYWKQLLKDIAAYPPERLFVTGQIRTDIIPALQQEKLSADSILGPEVKDKFLILLATQPQPDEGIRKKAALDMFAVAREMPNAWVLVRPHPREKDLSYYSELASQVGCTNYSFVYEHDLFLLLRLSHVLVHCYSTVGIEAVYFGLPAIILDYLNQDLLHFAAEGVAQQALDREDLRRILLNILEGRLRLDETKKQAYIQKYACSIDGKASERTAQALLDVVIADQ